MNESHLMTIYKIVDCGEAGRQECRDRFADDFDCHGCIAATVRTGKWSVTDPKGRPTCFDDDGHPLDVAGISAAFGPEVAQYFTD